jgi:hypothetical protein
VHFLLTDYGQTFFLDSLKLLFGQYRSAIRYHLRQDEKIVLRKTKQNGARFTDENSEASCRAFLAGRSPEASFQGEREQPKTVPASVIGLDPNLEPKQSIHEPK